MSTDSSQHGTAGPPADAGPPRPAHAVENAHGNHGHAHGLRVSGMSLPLGVGRALSVGIALNLSFVCVEVVFALWAHSLALLSDASHNFGDVISLGLAWGAMALAQRKPSIQFTYGFKGTTILAALINAMILLVVTGGIIWAAVVRLASPAAVNENVMIWVAALGTAINAGTAVLFLPSRGRDLNARGAFIHMAADAAVSVAVIAAGLVMRATGWLWLDPAASIAIAFVIFVGTWGLLRQSLRLAVQAVPSGVDAKAVRQYLFSQPGVIEAHDLHIWAMSTSENAMTAHLVMPEGHPGDPFLQRIADELDARFDVGHVTLQVETGGSSHACRLASEHAV